MFKRNLLLKIEKLQLKGKNGKTTAEVVAKTDDKQNHS